MKIKGFSKLIISVFIPLIVGYVGSLFTIVQIFSWYSGINKPNLLPPNWVFGLVWTLLYILMGIALFLVWNQKTKKDKKSAYFVFGLQLILNLLWSVFFFNQHWLFVSAVEILILWAAILGNIIKFRKISRPASYLLIPYLIWVSFASYLTISVWLLN